MTDASSPAPRPDETPPRSRKRRPPGTVIAAICLVGLYVVAFAAEGVLGVVDGDWAAIVDLLLAAAGIAVMVGLFLGGPLAAKVLVGYVVASVVLQLWEVIARDEDATLGAGWFLLVWLLFGTSGSRAHLRLGHPSATA